MLNEGCLLSKTRDFLVRPERRPGCSLRSYALDGPNGVDGSVSPVVTRCVRLSLYPTLHHPRSPPQVQETRKRPEISTAQRPLLFSHCCLTVINFSRPQCFLSQVEGMSNASFNGGHRSNRRHRTLKLPRLLHTRRRRKQLNHGPIHRRLSQLLTNRCHSSFKRLLTSKHCQNLKHLLPKFVKRLERLRFNIINASVPSANHAGTSPRGPATKGCPCAAPSPRRSTTETHRVRPRYAKASCRTDQCWSHL